MHHIRGLHAVFMKIRMVKDTYNRLVTDHIENQTKMCQLQHAYNTLHKLTRVLYKQMKHTVVELYTTTKLHTCLLTRCTALRVGTDILLDNHRRHVHRLYQSNQHYTQLKLAAEKTTRDQ